MGQSGHTSQNRTSVRCFKGCFNCIGVLVLFVSILLGLLFAGVPTHLGVFRYVDSFPVMQGLFPVLHEGIPWGFSLDAIPDLHGQTFVVTGANVGLGYWTAYHLAANGGHVVMACRSQARCDNAVAKIINAVPEASLETALLDLGSLQSVRAFGRKMAAQEGRQINSLILNAGVLLPKFKKSSDGLELHMAVNHFGHFALVQELENLVVATAAKIQAPTTIVVLSSCAHFSSYPEGVRLSLEELNDPATFSGSASYGQSKLANVLFAQELAERLRDQNVLVNSVHPGGVDTDVSRNINEMIESSLPKPIAEYVMKAIKVPSGMLLWDPREAALSQVFAAVGPQIIAGKVSGKYFTPIARQGPTHLHAQNQTLQKALWKFSVDVLESL